MKLRYKRAILFILLCTMGIGVLTLSVTPKDDGKNDKISNKDRPASSDITTESDAALSAAPDISGTLTDTVVPTATPIPTLSPTPLPLPVYPLESEGYPEIEALMKDYYDAKLNCDVDKLKVIMSDTSDIPSKEALDSNVMYVEEFQNLKCYVKKSFEEDSYIVIVYYEIKFMNIKTAAPAVKMFYVIPDGQSGYKIFSGALEDKLQEYYNARLQDDDIQEIIQDTEAKTKKAKEKDEYLKTFWEELQAVQKNPE